MARPYSVSVRIVEPGGNLLWVRRSASAPKRAGQYEYPGGHVEPGERAREAALREVREEVGLKIPEFELRVLERVEQEKGDHIVFEYRARKAFYPKLSFEHDHFIWSPEKPSTPALKRKPKRIIRHRRNGLFSYFKGKDTSGMTTEEKAKEAAVGVGVTAAVRGGSHVIKKKLAQRAAAKGAAAVGTKVAARGASKLIPGVGQAMMVYSAAPEAIAVVRESREHKKRTSTEVKAAKGLKAKVAAYGKGKVRETGHRLGGLGRIGAAAFVGSDVVKMGREAATERLMARENGVGSVVFRRGAQAGVRKAAKVAAQKGALGGLQTAARQAPKYTAAIGSLIKEAGKVVGVGAGVFGVSALAVQGAAAQVRGRRAADQAAQKPAAQNPSSIQANVAEINKLLKSMPPSWEQMLERNRSKLRAAGASDAQLPPKRPNAHNVLLALNLNNRGEVSSEAAAGQEQPGGNPVPAEVREAAMQGIRDSHENDYGGYDFIGVARAIQLAISPSISDAALNRMRMYFDRKTKQDRLSDQYAAKSGKRYWSWLNWGGDPGARWSGSTRFAELIKENPLRPVRRNFLFSKADPESMDAAQRAALIKQRSAELGNLYADHIIVRAPGKPGLFGGKVGPAYYMVGGFSARSLDDTSEYGMPVTYSELPSAGYLLHAFAAFSKTARASVALLDAYTGAVRKFDNINDYNVAVKAANGDWKALMAKNNRGRGRKNPFYVTTGGQAVPQAPGEDPRTWAATAAHAQRHESEGRTYRIAFHPETGYWFIVDKRTGKVVRDSQSGQPKYGLSKDGAQEVIKKLARRTNPSLAAFVADGQGLRLRDLIREGQGPEAAKSAGTRQAQSKKEGKKGTKKNPADIPNGNYSLAFLPHTTLSVHSASSWHRVAQMLRRKLGPLYDVSAGKNIYGQYTKEYPVDIGKILDGGLELIEVSVPKAALGSLTGNDAQYTQYKVGTRWEDKLGKLVERELSKDGILRAVSGSATRRNPAPGITMEEWFADVADSDWANYDLNRAGIMHYSGQGIPTYRSLYRS